MVVQVKRKMSNKDGFTMAELLIVVAIIAILVAISIPIFISKMEKSRESTDLANMRAAKAEIVAEYMADDSGIQTNKVYVFDAESGKIVKTDTLDNIEKYGKGKNNLGAYQTDASDCYLFVDVEDSPDSDGDDDNDDEVIVKGLWSKTVPTNNNSLKDWKDVYQPRS